MAPLPQRSRLIAVLAPGPPVGLAPAPSIVWCRTTSELVVLVRGGRVRIAVLDPRTPGVDGDLVELVGRGTTVVVIDAEASRARWEALGAIALAVHPGSLADLLAAVQAAGASSRADAAQAGRDDGAPPPAALVAVTGGDGADVTSAAVRVAAALAGDRTAGRVALVDLALDAPHRALHHLHAHDDGLPELTAACRFGTPPPAATDLALHPTDAGYLVVPGLRHHHDWVSLGLHSTRTALAGLRAAVGIVVVHVDADLEGEQETGSFDIEDRNLLARTVAADADLVIVTEGTSRPSRAAAVVLGERWQAFGVAADRIIGTHGHDPRSRLPQRRLMGRSGRGRASRRLASMVRDQLARNGPRLGPGGSGGAEEPERVVPGTLGHWAHDADGWMTPRAPQQP